VTTSAVRKLCRFTGLICVTRHSLYKYFTERRWANEFLDGKLLFRSLSYFRDIEDKNVREDSNEGNAILRPEGGLVVNNETQGTTFTLADYAFQSKAKQAEIFVFCMSRSLTDEMRESFQSVACIEVLNVAAFCSRVEAVLPSVAKFPDQAGGRHARIGRRVEYYRETEGGNPRWALPDMIATSKLDSYTWQNEFRLVFTLTDAFEFENVETRLVHRSNPREVAKPDEHHVYPVQAQSLVDICRMHEF
jgi:hypothetical protein